MTPPVPRPRRTRSGAVVVGPTVGARWRPGALYGLPLVALLLSPFAAAGLQQWRASRVAAGHEGILEALLASGAAQILLGALLLWALFALWALVPLAATHTTVLLDEGTGGLRRRRGLRAAGRAELRDLVHAVGDPERGGLGELLLRDPDGGPPTRWVLADPGWDDRSFDGLRVLQAAAGLPPAPDRASLVNHARRRRREGVHRELAARAGMVWREEYAEDEAAFRAEFDRMRRVIGGREPGRPDDPPRA